MTRKLTKAQREFLANYSDFLVEVEASLQYVSECYIKDDHDIGDRLMKSVMAGLEPYNEENLTLQSIFHEDETALRQLKTFIEAARWAIEVESSFPSEEQRMRFLHETLMPRLKNWKGSVDRYAIELA
ncbi:hypothetical protein [Salisediminibacterium selenitireducens]|uniref:DUF8042 domain-containing protein n=1 Tax=Bacillus selenitireducens (strain ATCC 700615 / DSM 15326 / MLS10) TaxID=439292 RepID=D6Y0Y2_BACIE|nr:hypothetical protein [Salisediminibacterium selenitireducens]ADH98586.1 hypothetical protein Bsel_1068 [[Bacillus] selenitireducens MLS10]